MYMYMYVKIMLHFIVGTLNEFIKCLFQCLELGLELIPSYIGELNIWICFFVSDYSFNVCTCETNT